MTINQTADSPSGNPVQLLLGTGAFAFCFAVFGSVSAMMPIIRKQLDLSPIQVSVAIAIPVLLGSLGRIPLGILTDRFGGRLIFSIVMACSVVPAIRSPSRLASPMASARMSASRSMQVGSMGADAPLPPPPPLVERSR